MTGNGLEILVEAFHWKQVENLRNLKILSQKFRKNKKKILQICRLISFNLFCSVELNW